MGSKKQTRPAPQQKMLATPQVPRPPPAVARGHFWVSVALGLGLFHGMYRAFVEAPVHQITDSHYTLLAAEQLLAKGNLALDDAFPPPRDPKLYREGEPLRYHSGEPGYPYQVQVLPASAGKERVLPWYPPGTIVLSAPMLAVAHAWDLRAMRADGTYDAAGEEDLQAVFAALLMAGFCVVVFATSRLWLSHLPSTLVAVATGLSTMVWSTSSRALWSSTWGILLLALAIYELARTEVRRQPSPCVDPPQPNVVWLGTLLAWSWFCRPSFALHIMLLTGFVFWRNRTAGVKLAGVGALWLLGFVMWSHATSGEFLPDYYRHGKFAFSTFFLGLAANLISPSRGLLVYAPVTLALAWLTWRFRRHLPAPALALLVGLACGAHLLLLAPYPTWWAGHAYGARFTVELVPWLALLAPIALRAGLDAARQDRTARPAWRLGVGAALVLAGLGGFINGRGAWSDATFHWNVQPVNVDHHPIQACWDWRYPQFLAGLIPWPMPEKLEPLAIGRWLELGRDDTDPYLLEGWGYGEGDFRWTTETKARMAFRLDKPRAVRLTVKWQPFLHLEPPHQHLRQRLTLTWNGQAVARPTLVDPRVTEATFDIPAHAVAVDNVLALALPDARAPKSLGYSTDTRHLGLAVQRLRVD